jgi:hypothetical protein
MTSNLPLTAPELCSRIVHLLEDDLTHAYTYGAGTASVTPIGGEHTVTALTTQAGQPRWFTIAVREFDPDTADPLSLNYDVLRDLALRAGVPAPIFRLGGGAHG